MGFSLSLVVGVLLCIYQTGAVAISKSEDVPKSNETFTIHVSERGTKFVERIIVDKDREIEYFKVPPHNKLSESDNMYDFKMNITVSRVKKERVCQISPLPRGLPRPDVLEKGLKLVSRSPPSHKIKKVSMQWIMGPRVDKSTLRQEVRDFCGDFPIYRLLPYTPDSMSVHVGEVSKGRSRRDTPDIRTFPACKPPLVDCHPDSWIYTCRIKTARCVYYISCNLDAQKNVIDCEKISQHEFDSIVCCDPACP